MLQRYHRVERKAGERVGVGKPSPTRFTADGNADRTRAFACFQPSEKVWVGFTAMNHILWVAITEKLSKYGLFVWVALWVARTTTENTINGQKGYYLYDGRGSVASMTGQSGGNMIQYVYDAYGVTTKTNNTLNNPYQYNAEYTDSSTGNQYLRARYYDAANGRFLTKDTYLGETNDPLSRNLYTYVRNNPINLIDPTGHLFGLIIGLVAVGTAMYGGYRAIKDHNEQSKQIRDQQKPLEDNAYSVVSSDKVDLNNLQTGNGIYQYHNKKDKKVVTFTNAAAYYEYKRLCEELDRLDKNLAINIVHNTLDAVGVIPGVGEVADAVNGTIYLAEGDYVNAGLSFVSCVPLAGDALGKGGKAVNTTLDIAKHSDEFSVVAKYGDEALDALNDVSKSSKPMTWDEFQHANKGKYTKSEMSDAWNKYKKATKDNAVVDVDSKKSTTDLSSSDVSSTNKTSNSTNHGVLSNEVYVNGKRVITNNDIFDPNFIDPQGRTNVERMKQGLAPIGTDGKSVNIHHIDQTNDGPVMEITETEHHKNYSSLHTNTGQSPSQINRNDFNKWRSNYWKWRADNLN